MFAPNGIGSPFTYSFPRLSVDGNELFVRVNETPNKIVSYGRASATAPWLRGPVVFSSTTTNLMSSAPTRGPNRRVVVALFDGSGSSVLVELLDGNGTWSMQGNPYAPSDLGGATIGAPFLSEDGQRLMFTSVTSATNVMRADDGSVGGRATDQRRRAIAQDSESDRVRLPPLAGPVLFLRTKRARLHVRFDVFLEADAGP